MWCHQTFGISRAGSGSQLMVYVLAMERAWHPQRDVHFEVKGDFKSKLQCSRDEVFYLIDY